MAVTNGWGQATQNNTNGFGKYQNTIDAGSVYADSYAGETSLEGTSASFLYSKSSFHQDEADPTPTITGTTGGTFNASAGLVFVDTGTHNSSTGQIDLSASTIASHIITYTVGGVQSGQTIGITASPLLTNTHSFLFDGTNYIQAGNFSFLENITQFTICFYAKFASGGTFEQTIFTNRNQTSSWADRVEIYRYGSDVYFHVNNSSQGGSKNAYLAAPANNLWTHIAMVFDGSQAVNDDRIKIYFDGSIQSPTISSNFNTSTSTGATSLIGARTGSANKEYSGQLDEFAIWNTALSSDAVQEIYNATANNTGKALDLTQDSGNYNASSNLQYFNRLGD